MKFDSHYLSYILRHHPEEIGLKLDEYGYADVNKLCKALHISKEDLETIVNNNTRYIYSPDHTKIKAAHGHSIPVKYENEAEPPVYLYHGTSEDAAQNIKLYGIKPMSRDSVHLSEDEEKAFTIGLRHTGGKRFSVVIFKVNALHMYQDGYTFYKSEDNVWLTKEIPIKYISILSIGDTIRY